MTEQIKSELSYDWTQILIFGSISVGSFIGLRQAKSIEIPLGESIAWNLGAWLIAFACGYLLERCTLGIRASPRARVGIILAGLCVVLACAWPVRQNLELLLLGFAFSSGSNLIRKNRLH